MRAGGELRVRRGHPTNRQGHCRQPGDRLHLELFYLRLRLWLGHSGRNCCRGSLLAEGMGIEASSCCWRPSSQASRLKKQLRREKRQESLTRRRSPGRHRSRGLSTPANLCKERSSWRIGSVRA
eukprot:765809-Hanusia_phi.AAC.3